MNNTYNGRVYFTTAKPTFLRVISVQAPSKNEARLLIHSIAKEAGDFDYIDSIRKVN